MGLSNDERGWIMSSLSGIACVFGASIICIDIIVRLFPGKKHFRIQDSDAFLSASLSLSFGVMLFSALYNMLPSAKRSLEEGGFAPKQASWVLVGCFIGGILGIQIVSRVLHHFIPSHVVDCEHTHEETSKQQPAPHHTCEHESLKAEVARKHSLSGHTNRGVSDRRPASRHSLHFAAPMPSAARTHDVRRSQSSNPVQGNGVRRPSLPQRLKSSLSLMMPRKGSTCECDEHCYGYTDPCGNECFKNINARGGYRANGGGQPPMSKTSSIRPGIHATESTPLLENVLEDGEALQRHPRTLSETAVNPRLVDIDHRASTAGSSTVDPPASRGSDITRVHSSGSHHHADHHHHVPTNAFLSIGLQTSIAIALHKLPEGFITYATNHANPELGFAVFLALFIHNITEGFAMALPLYLALDNRPKAMTISFVLGGLTQPLGAGVAAIWFRVAGQGDWAPTDAVYGGMFAVTAGIMASVALQLFSEALDLTHSRTLCMIGAFTGMGILGASSALTA